MKKILIVLSLFCTLGFSHNLIMEVLDNEDNTLTIVGAYNTGDKAAGAMIRFESLSTGEILYKKRLPYESELTISIPNEAYQIVLDGGPDHVLIQVGISPKEGFSKNQESQVNGMETMQTSSMTLTTQLSQAKNNTNIWGNLTIFLFTICLILFLLAIYFSFKNTEKIINEIRKSNANIE
ncbi:MAG: hypothetical protein HRT41_09710 [Campylobacteraceae bacterium]|nr:hypothetical protein [Campylobacteraceae bacterium]